MNLNNISDIYNQIKNATSIKDVGKQALLALEKKDPATARMLCAMIYGKQNPVQVMQQFSRSGKINLKQIDKIHTGYNMLKKLGLKLSIPDTVWIELQQIASSEQDLIIPKQRKGF